MDQTMNEFDQIKTQLYWSLKEHGLESIIYRIYPDDEMLLSLDDIIEETCYYFE